MKYRVTLCPRSSSGQLLVLTIRVCARDFLTRVCIAWQRHVWYNIVSARHAKLFSAF